MNDSGKIGFGAIAILLAVTLLIPQRSATAGIIATNLGAGNTYSTTTAYNLSGPQASVGGEGLAVEFHISGSSSIAFGSAELALQFHSGTNSVNILLMSSTNNLPGTTLESYTLTNIPTGPSLVTATSTTNTLLTPGTNYWLVAIASGNTYMTWMANTTGAVNDLAHETQTSNGPGTWALASGTADAAFQINSAAVAVPAPSSIAMLGVGLVSVFGYGTCRRWRRRR